jgi:hypothetical protein
MCGFEFPLLAAVFGSAPLGQGPGLLSLLVAAVSDFVSRFPVPDRARIRMRPQVASFAEARLPALDKVNIGMLQWGEFGSEARLLVPGKANIRMTPVVGFGADSIVVAWTMTACSLAESSFRPPLIGLV